MTLSDRKSTLCAAAEAADGRTGLIAQIGSNAIEEIKELADAAYENGYQAISAVSPYYYSYPKEDIINHYLRVAEYSRLPLIVYNIPVRTSVSLDKSDFGRLFEHKNIAGVKFTSQDMFLLERLRDEFPDKIIFSGYDEFLFSSTILGTDGTIGTTYNVIGKFAKKVFEAVAASDIKAGLAAQRQINTVVELLLETGIFQTIKALIEEYGVKAANVVPDVQNHRKTARTGQKTQGVHRKREMTKKPAGHPKKRDIQPDFFYQKLTETALILFAPQLKVTRQPSILASPVICCISDTVFAPLTVFAKLSVTSCPCRSPRRRESAASRRQPFQPTRSQPWSRARSKGRSRGERERPCED